MIFVWCCFMKQDWPASGFSTDCATCRWAVLPYSIIFISCNQSRKLSALTGLCLLPTAYSPPPFCPVLLVSFLILGMLFSRLQFCFMFASFYRFLRKSGQSFIIFCVFSTFLFLIFLHNLYINISFFLPFLTLLEFRRFFFFYFSFCVLTFS